MHTHFPARGGCARWGTLGIHAIYGGGGGGGAAAAVCVCASGRFV